MIQSTERLLCTHEAIGQKLVISALNCDHRHSNIDMGVPTFHEEHNCQADIMRMRNAMVIIIHSAGGFDFAELYKEWKWTSYP